LLLICCVCLSVAQINKAEFFRDFAKASSTNKVVLTASHPYAKISDIYPQIKDTLEAIRQKIYRGPSSENKSIKLLFDKLDADIQLYNQNFEKATIILESALQFHAANIDDTLKCLCMLKRVFIKMKNINRAFEIQYMIDSRLGRKTDSIKLDLGASRSYLYTLMGLKTEAINARRKEFNNSDDKHDTDAVINFYNDMGVFFNNKKLSDSAETYFLKAKYLLSAKQIPKVRQAHYDFYKGLVDGNLGLSYFNRGQVNEALPLLKHDVHASLRSNNYESGFNSYRLIVECYISLKDKQLAGAYLDSAETLLKERLPGVGYKLKLLPIQASYYNLVNDYKKAATIYKEYFALNDSMLSLEKAKEIINQGITFSIEQREIEHFEKEKLLKQIQLDDANKKFYKAYLLAGFLILCVIILFLVINNRESKKREEQLSNKNKHIRFQNSQIEQSLKEKEALIKEIHHRVKNNLQIITSMLNLQMSKVDDEKVELILFEAKQRINAIALTHQMLYQKATISNIRIGEYIETLVKQIERTMSSPLIELVTEISASESQLTIDGAVPLGLIISELLTNAYKHAFPKGRQGKVIVSVIENPDSFTIKVSDNGIGLADNFDISENKTLGMELVQILVEQLDSQLIIENNNGTTFKFDVKKT